MTPTEIAARMRAQRGLNKLVPAPEGSPSPSPWMDKHTAEVIQLHIRDRLASEASEMLASSPNSGAGLPDVECTCALCQEAAAAAASDARAVAAPAGRSIFDAISWERTPLPQPHWRPLPAAAKPPLHRRVWAAIGRWHARMMGRV